MDPKISVLFSQDSEQFGMVKRWDRKHEVHCIPVPLHHPTKVHVALAFMNFSNLSENSRIAVARWNTDSFVLKLSSVMACSNS